MSEFWAGLDLGQAQDYTALIIVERHAEEAPTRYDVRHIERFPLGTSYPSIVEQVKELLLRPELGGVMRLVLDATGVGRAVSDLFQSLGPVPVTITGGDTTTEVDGHWRVPKRDLVGVVQVLLQSGCLKFAAGLPEAQLLVNELLTFQVKVSVDTGHDTYGAPWREGAHDDLVLALALACWYPERAWNPFAGMLFVAGVRGWTSNADAFGGRRRSSDADVRSVSIFPGWKPSESEETDKAREYEPRIVTSSMDGGIPHYYPGRRDRS